MKTMLIVILMGAMQLAAQDMESCPMHKQHVSASQHQGDVEKRGDHAMGFSHEKTTHHFRLYADGGAIEVTANDIKDEGSVEEICSHLEHIASMFTAGDFSAPMFIHDQVPPGVPVMKEKREKISYTFEELASGGRVRIKTGDAEALRAVHEFLRFQIEDHHTGDHLAVAKGDRG